DSRYNEEDVHNAVSTQINMRLIDLLHSNRLTEWMLVRFLDSYMVLSLSESAHAELWDRARQQINLLIGAVQDLKFEDQVDPHRLHLLRIEGEKRKIGYNPFIMDLANSMRKVVSSVVAPNGQIYLLDKGRVGRVDAINSGNWIAREKAPPTKNL